MLRHRRTRMEVTQQAFRTRSKLVGRLLRYHGYLPHLSSFCPPESQGKLNYQPTCSWAKMNPLANIFFLIRFPWHLMPFYWWIYFESWLCILALALLNSLDLQATLVQNLGNQLGLGRESSCHSPGFMLISPQAASFGHMMCIYEGALGKRKAGGRIWLLSKCINKA